MHKSLSSFCVTVTVAVAPPCENVTVAVRDEPVFAVAVSVTEVVACEPEPEVGDTDNQFAEDVAVQFAEDVPARTETVSLPPPLGNVTVLGDTLSDEEYD